jgi:hypothetical protein
LEIKLAACFESLIAVVCITFDVLKKLIAGVSIRQQNILNNIKPKNFLLENSFIVQEFLLLGRDLTCDHGLSGLLLFVCQFPVLKWLNACIESSFSVSCLCSCFLVKSGLSVNDEWQKLGCKCVVSCHIQAVTDVNEGFPFTNGHQTLDAESNEWSLDRHIKLSNLIEPFSGPSRVLFNFFTSCIFSSWGVVLDLLMFFASFAAGIKFNGTFSLIKLRFLILDLIDFSVHYFSEFSTFL